MDLVREILLAVEAAEGSFVTPASMQLPGRDTELVARHMDLMIEAGLLDGEDMSDTGGHDAFARRLTWEGYDFLDSVRSDAVWNDTTASIARTVGSASFEVVKVVATGFAMKALGL